MAFIPAPNVAQVELRMSYFGQNVENTLYFLYPDGLDVAAMTTLADYIDTWWNAFMKPIQSNSVVFREVYVTDLTTAVSPTVADTSSAGIVGGTSTSSGMPGNVTICTSFRTAGRGRSARGRNYFIGLVESVVTGNAATTTLTTALVEAYEALLLSPEPGFTWVVLSRFAEGAPRVTALAQTVTSVVLVDSNVDSQRRRLEGRGT